MSKINNIQMHYIELQDLMLELAIDIDEKDLDEIKKDIKKIENNINEIKSIL